jgi:hypothetical protein
MAAGRGTRGRKPIDPWKALATFLSGIFMTLAVFLLLMAVSEVLVYLIDSIMNGNESYLDWWSTPLMMVIVSLPFFLGYFLVNLYRFTFYQKLKDSIRLPGTRKPDVDRRMEKIELD